MQAHYRTLKTVSLARARTFLEPPTPTLSLQSAATSFMTDFHTIHPITITSSTNINDALNLMKRAYVRMLLVTNSDRSEFMGIVTATDINSGKVLAYMADNFLKDRNEVLVSNIMIDKEHIHGLDYEMVASASIGDILETIKNLGEQHILVVDSSEDAFCIRGIFSTTNIAKALHIKFDVEPQAKTFFELEQAILHRQIA